MRALATLLAVAATTVTAVVAAPAPVSASHQCGRNLCLVTDGMTIPVGTPVVPPTGGGPSYVPGPRLCDTTTGECRQTYVLLPTAFVSSDGTTLTTVTIPEYGVALASDGTPTVYYGIPPLPPLDPAPADSVTVVASLPFLPVMTSGDDEVYCPTRAIQDKGPVRVRLASCRLILSVVV